MWKKNRVRIPLLLLLVAAISSLHYFTTTHHSHLHDIYRRLYYIPIVLGGVWYALRGGLGMSLLVSLVYVPHILIQWQRMPMAHPEQYLELLLYNVIGGLTGLLVAKEHAQRLRAEQSAKELGDSYDQLRHQADMILEIEDQLRQADRLTAMGELSAGLAHEIRNPLASIRGTAEILKDAFAPEHRYAEFTTILISEVDRLNQVLEDFLHFARPSSSSHPHFSPCEILHEVVKLTAVKARKNTIDILCPDLLLPIAVGDSAQFKQVFLNLVLNALQAMPQGGALRIEVQQLQQRVFLTFCDSGPGIAAADLDQVFQPFYTTKQDGTGLGLAITQRIVQNSGGHISVSCPETGGCCFTLDLAVAENVQSSEEHHD